MHDTIAHSVASAVARDPCIDTLSRLSARPRHWPAPLSKLPGTSWGLAAPQTPTFCTRTKGEGEGVAACAPKRRKGSRGEGKEKQFLRLRRLVPWRCQLCRSAEAHRPQVACRWLVPDSRMRHPVRPASKAVGHEAHRGRPAHPRFGWLLPYENEPTHIWGHSFKYFRS